MNREIKFRAWDKIDKKWMDDEWIGCQMIMNLNTAESRYIFIQDTGIKDKNGVEIYEGDIVKLWEGTFKECIEEIMFKNGCFGIDYYRGVIPIQEIMEEESEYVDILEVIGNIYENPGLLTNKN